MDDEHYFPWHFDGNDFTVSILVQQAEQGGDFEYVPNIRTSDDENFEGVNKILNGHVAHTAVRNLVLQALRRESS